MTASPPPQAAAWLLNGDETYGVGGPVLDLATGLLRRGWKPLILTLTEGPLTETARGRGLQVRTLGQRLPAPFASRNPFKIVAGVIEQVRVERRLSRRIGAALLEHGCRHLGVRWPNHVRIGGLSAREAGVPCYWMMPNEIGNNWPLGLNRKLYRRVCRTLQVQPLPNSRYTGRTLSDNLDDRVLYLGVDATRFDPQQVEPHHRESLGIPADATVVGVLARLTPDKGQDLLLKAVLKEHDGGNENLHLVLVGGPTDSDYAESLRTLAKTRHFADRLHMVGWAADPERYYGLIDVAVNSRVDPEPFGLSVVEAMMMGRPPLVHAVGGPAETVEDGVSGWHVQEASVGRYHTALQRVLADRGRWPAMGVEARRQAIERFSTDAFVDRYIELTGDR